VRATSAGSAWALLWADGLIIFLSLFHFGTLVDDPVPFDTAVNYLAQRVAVSVDALSASKQSTKSVGVDSQNIIRLGTMSLGHCRIDAVMGPPSEREAKAAVSR